MPKLENLTCYGAAEIGSMPNVWNITIHGNMSVLPYMPKLSWYANTKSWSGAEIIKDEFPTLLELAAGAVGCDTETGVAELDELLGSRKVCHACKTLNVCRICVLRIEILDLTHNTTDGFVGSAPMQIPLCGVCVRPAVRAIKKSGCLDP